MQFHSALSRSGQLILRALSPDGRFVMVQTDKKTAVVRDLTAKDQPVVTSYVAKTDDSDSTPSIGQQSISTGHRASASAASWVRWTVSGPRASASRRR